jgi:hypothetical protein
MNFFIASSLKILKFYNLLFPKSSFRIVFQLNFLAKTFVARKVYWLNSPQHNQFWVQSSGIWR